MGKYKQEPLKILMTADTVGGVWTYCMELCSALQQENIQFHLITMGAPMKEGQRNEVAALHNVCVYETDFLLEWMDDPWEDLAISRAWLLQLAERLQPDLIHLNNFCYGALPFKAPVVVVAHSDVWTWWQAVHGENPPAAWDRYYQEVKEGLQGADLITAPSQAVLHDIQSIYEVDTAHKIIYNARNKALFHTGEKEKYVFSMGRVWDEAKNIQLLQQAAPYIKHPVRIAGSNQSGSNELKLNEENLLYLGHLHAEQISMQLSTASVYCLPAKYEPFGLSILEAALSGCALVLGDVESLREIWQNNALYVSTTDAVALADAINNLLEDEKLCRHYGQKAYYHAQQFSTQRLAQQYTKVYHQLIRKAEPVKTEAV